MGLLVGSIMPFLFAALTMQAVGRAAAAMVAEIRRQFREICRPDRGHGQCRLRPRRRHQHARRHEGDGPARPDRHRRPRCRRRHTRPRGPGRPAHRRHSHRLPARHHDGQRGRRLGQRQEVHRGRTPRRQGLRPSRRRCRGRHRRRPIQGHLRPRPEHPHQAHVYRRPRLRPLFL